MKANKIYKGLIGVLEGLELNGNLKRNGHHLAQQLASNVELELLPKKAKKVVNVLLEQGPCTAKEIADFTDDSSKNVSAILQQLLKTSTLVIRKGDTRKYIYDVASRHHFKN